MTRASCMAAVVGAALGFGAVLGVLWVVGASGNPVGPGAVLWLAEGAVLGAVAGLLLVALIGWLMSLAR